MRRKFLNSDVKSENVEPQGKVGERECKSPTLRRGIDVITIKMLKKYYADG